MYVDNRTMFGVLWIALFLPLPALIARGDRSALLAWLIAAVALTLLSVNAVREHRIEQDRQKLKHPKPPATIDHRKQRQGEPNA